MELLSNEMVNKAISGDTEAVEQLTKRFMPLFRAYSNSYFILGGDKEDVIQEGMLGLFFAMRDYKKEYCDFEPFAKSCIRHRILTAIRLANAKKHLPLNNRVELTDEESKQGDPMELLLKKEWHETFWKAVEMKLSKTERAVVILYTSGLTYAQIALKLNKDEKTVDNALQRARKKLIKEVM